MAVYFMQAGYTGPVKIGHTNNVARRRQMLQTGSTEEIRIIGELDGGDRLERWLHWRFADRRTRGEFFEFDNAMLTIQSELDGVDVTNIPVEERPARQRSAEKIRADAIFDLDAVASAYGNLSTLARRLGLTHSTVYTWRYHGSVPLWRQNQIKEALFQDGLLTSEAA